MKSYHLIKIQAIQAIIDIRIEQKKKASYFKAQELEESIIALHREMLVHSGRLQRDLTNHRITDFRGRTYPIHNHEELEIISVVPYNN